MTNHAGQAILELVRQEFLDNIHNPVTTLELSIPIHPANLKPNSSGLISIPIPRYGDIIQQFVMNITAGLENISINKAMIITRPNYGKGPESLVKHTSLHIASLKSGSTVLTSEWEHNLVNPDMLELVIQISPELQISKINLTGCFIYLGIQQRRALFCKKSIWDLK
jgi:hypothetical protein